MNNTTTCFKCEIDDLRYSTVERKISDYFDMGYPASSSFPPVLPEETYGTYILSCDDKIGEFAVSVYKLNNGKYRLSVSLIGKLSKA